jgi:ribosome-associated heat shock protein Hsp15
MHQTPRIDKWLWEVRVYKTRSLATEACRSGKVKISDIAVKPSREIKPEEIISISFGPIQKRIKVIGFPVSRVSAKLVPDYMEDMTTPEEYEKLKMQHETNYEYRPRGIGRPTKKERRLIDRLKNFKHF